MGTEVLKDPNSNLFEYFDALDIDASNIGTLFRMMEVDSDGNVHIDDFCEACMRFRGAARSYDVHRLLSEIKPLCKVPAVANLILSESRNSNDLATKSAARCQIEFGHLRRSVD